MVGAAERAREALEQAGEDGDVFLLEETADRLEELELEWRDPRLWFLIGSGEVLPLLDRSVDVVLGEGADVERVLR